MQFASIICRVQKGIATAGKDYDMLTIRSELRRKKSPEKYHAENIY